MKRFNRITVSVFIFCLIAIAHIPKGICEFRHNPMVISSSTVIDRDWEFAQTAFIISGNNIILDLGGHTITFNTNNFSEAINRDFEGWNGSKPVGWGITGGNAEPVPAIYFGKFDLILSPGGGIESTPIRLKGGKTYLAFAFVKGSDKDKVKLSIVRAADKALLAETSWGDSIFSRGYASKGSAENDLRYKPKGDIDIILRFEIIGTSPCRLGMVDIKPAFDYGVITNNYHNGIYLPDLDSRWFKGFSKNIIIRNGKIKQGNGHGVRSTGIRLTGESWTLQNLSIEMNGINTDGINGSELTNVMIDSCKIESSSIAVFNRMHGSAGINLGKPAGLTVINNNTISHVPQTGISIEGCYREGDRTRYQITGNTIKQKEIITEGYGIGVSGIKDYEIAGNLIEPYQGRGILIDASSGCSSGKPGTLRGKIFSNRILGLYEISNFEYDANHLECAGIRIRNWGEENQSHKDLQVYNNVITGRTDASGVHKVYGINVTASSPNDSIKIFENDISVTAEGRGRSAAALVFQGTKVQGNNYVYAHENKLSSNSEIIRFGGNDGADVQGVLLEGNILSRLTHPMPIGKPFSYGYWIGKETNNVLAKNIPQTTEADPSLLQNIAFDGTGLKSLMIGRYRIEVLIRLSGVPIAGAVVTLKDKGATILMERETDFSGKAILYAPSIFYAAGPSAPPVQRKFKKEESFSVTASFNGISKSITISGDKDKVLEINLKDM